MSKKIEKRKAKEKRKEKEKKILCYFFALRFSCAF